MTPGDFRPLLGGAPFRPFALVMSSGERVEVRHPELAAVTGTNIRVTELTPTGRLSDRSNAYPLGHVVTIEFLDVGPS